MKTELATGLSKYTVKLTLTTDMLGTLPKNKEVYAAHVQTKAAKLGNEQAQAEIDDIQNIEEKGWTGFYADKDGLYIRDYMIRGFLKNAGKVLKGMVEVKNPKSKIDSFVFVFPMKIHPQREGKNIVKEEGTFERPLRAETMQGPRVTLAKSDLIKSGATIEFNLHIIPGCEYTEKKLTELFEYGKYQGLGQFRNGSYGRFDFSIVKLK